MNTTRTPAGPAPIRFWRRARMLPLVAVSLLLAAALVGAARASGGPAPPRVEAVTLPRDHGAHSGFQIEWWYTAGTFADSSGHPYFWFATVWATGQGMTARVNVVDLRQDRIVLAQQYFAATPPTAGQTSMRVGTFSLGWASRGSLGRWSVDATTPAGRLTLSLRPGQPYLLHGSHGIIQQGSGGPSAYYSEPRLEATGVLDLGKRQIAIHGEGWLDHQWGNFMSDPGALRWNWFACQFRDGSDLMLYQFLNPHAQPSGTIAGTFTNGKGKVTRVARFSASGMRPFIHPAGAKATYPLRWRVDIPAPKLSLTLQSRARHQYIANQVLPSFWEGAAAITSGPPGSCIVESSREG
jgi:predicted secreted hydrolase